MAFAETGDLAGECAEGQRLRGGDAQRAGEPRVAAGQFAVKCQRFCLDALGSFDEALAASAVLRRRNMVE
jgi:hypothetical protein